MSALPVLLLQLGEAVPLLQRAHGKYVDWFRHAWGGDLAVVDGRNGEPLPACTDFAGVLISGSASSLVTPEPWMERAADFVRAAHENSVPTLGICFGHQLIGHALGAKVIANPRGWEIGTQHVDLSADGKRDPLFTDLPARIAVNLSHADVIEWPTTPTSETTKTNGTGALRVLAYNAKTDVQAFAAGDTMRGIQFHPEFSGAVCRGYIDARRPQLDGQDVQALLADTRDAPDAVAVLLNFRRHFVEA